MKTNKVLVFDPSGNFGKTGNGTTGVIIGDSEVLKLLRVGNIISKKFHNAEEYFNFHAKLIEKIDPDYVVVEGFRIDASNKGNSFSQGETIQLIGVIKIFCYNADIKFKLQYNTQIKVKVHKEDNYERKGKFSNEKLAKLGLFTIKGDNRLSFEKTKTTKHIRDAARHYVVWFKNKENK